MVNYSSFKQIQNVIASLEVCSELHLTDTKKCSMHDILCLIKVLSYAYVTKIHLHGFFISEALIHGFNQLKYLSSVTIDSCQLTKSILSLKPSVFLTLMVTGTYFFNNTECMAKCDKLIIRQSKNTHFNKQIVYTFVNTSSVINIEWDGSEYYQNQVQDIMLEKHIDSIARQLSCY